MRLLSVIIAWISMLDNSNVPGTYFPNRETNTKEPTIARIGFDHYQPYRGLVIQMFVLQIKKNMKKLKSIIIPRTEFY